VAVLVRHARSIGEAIPYRFALNRLARLLSEQPPVAPTTDDFVAFLFSEDVAEELIDNLNVSASPQAASVLRTKRLLPDRWEDLDGAPRFLE
jgi:hypothetical protein